MAESRFPPDPKMFDELFKRLGESLPPGLKQLQGDLEKNLHAAMQSAFARMDLVTREEFDVQQAVLARTRAKVEALERQLAALEARLEKGEQAQ
ncbi:MAG: accessory factor UbiK family protein [Candidatus Competibacteraceae bacterium]|nr:accessory factor UbiK family protein [Candidatus Competibacteraceae bacterium]